MSGNTARPPSIFTRPFVLLCCALFLGYANQWVMTPLIPLYVDSLGGSAFVAGLALLAFSLPSSRCGLWSGGWWIAGMPRA